MTVGPRTRPEPGRVLYCQAAAAAYDDHGAPGLAEVARRLASDPLADRLVATWRPATPLLVVAALRQLTNRGVPDPAVADAAGVLERSYPHRDAIGAFVRRHRVQFSEPLRASLLLPGLLLIAREYGRPLRLIELGAGAGLLLAFDRYRHVFPTGTWGRQDAAVTLTSPLAVPAELFATEVQVVDRVGVDLAPLDAADQSDVALLRAFAWSGPREREQRLEQACAVVAADPPRLVRGDAVDVLPELLAESSADVTTVVFEAGMLNQLDNLQRLRLHGRLATAGERVPVVALFLPGGDPGPLGCRFMLTPMPRRDAPRTYAHADLLGERASWHGPVDAAFDALSSSLGRAGQWRLCARPLGAPDEQAVPEIAPFLTALGMVALAQSTDERATALRARSAEHLELTVQGPSLWRYYRDTPCDADDTSLAALALGREHRLVRGTPSAEPLIANRTSRGLFRTWLLWPRAGAAERDDAPMLDVTVNANVVALLGERAETRAAIEWIRSCIFSGTEAANSWYYRDPLAVHLATQRAVDAGVPSLRAAADVAAFRARQLLDNRTVTEPHRLASAALVATWRSHRLSRATGRWVRSELLAAQRLNGTWPPGIAYVGVAPPGEPTVEFRSAPLTTALCVSAILRLESLTT